MEFGYSEKQLEIKAMLRDFAEREIAPILNKMDRDAILETFTFGAFGTQQQDV